MLRIIFTAATAATVVHSVFSFLDFVRKRCADRRRRSVYHVPKWTKEGNRRGLEIELGEHGEQSVERKT